MRLDVQDVVGLAVGVRWNPDTGCVEDTALRLDHGVNGSAGLLVAELSGGRCTIAELAALLVDRYGIDERTARADVLEVVAVLDDHALVSVDRPRRLVWTPSALATAVVALVLGSDVFLARRRPASVAGIVRATTGVLLWPSLVLVVGAVALLGALYDVHPHVGVGTLVDGALLVGALLLSLWATLAAHEIGHLGALGAARHEAVLVVRGWRMALLHRRDAATRTRRVALAGPLAGIGAGLALAPFGLVDALGVEFAAVTCAVGLSHAVHLGPWAADGALIWRRRARRSAGAVA